MWKNVALLAVVLFLSSCSARTAKYAAKEMANNQSGDTLTTCKLNLKNLATAEECYSTDHGGKYAQLKDLDQGSLKLAQLTAVPTCPTGAIYKMELKEKSFLISCTGDHSSDKVPAGYPQYSSVKGLEVTGSP